MNWFLALLIVASHGLVTCTSEAADRARPIQIGVLTPSWGPPPQVVGLRELGYREHEQFVIGVRFTQGDLAALPAAARKLVQLGPDLIFAHRDDAATAARLATTRIPIVFVGVNDPVGLGLVQSYASPGGNITGVTDLELELGPKRLEVFHEVVPGLKRVLFLYNATDTYSAAGAKVYRKAAHRLGIELVERAVRTEEEARATLAQIRMGDVDGILRPPSPSLNIPGFILEASSRRAIPTMFNGAFWAEQGALASYGQDPYETGRQSARLVGKILKGTAPAKIPVEVNPKIEFAINLKVVKALRLRIPPGGVVSS